MISTFKGVDEEIVRTTSCRDLLERLNVYDNSLICSLVHKFGRRGGEAHKRRGRAQIHRGGRPGAGRRALRGV